MICAKDQCGGYINEGIGTDVVVFIVKTPSVRYLAVVKPGIIVLQCSKIYVVLFANFLILLWDSSVHGLSKQNTEAECMQDAL